MPAISPIRALLTPIAAACLAGLLAVGCTPAPAPDASSAQTPPENAAQADGSYAQHAGDYAVVPLTADLSAFDSNGKRIIAMLAQASEVMDDLY